MLTLERYSGIITEYIEKFGDIPGLRKFNKRVHTFCKIGGYKLRTWKRYVEADSSHIPDGVYLTKRLRIPSGEVVNDINAIKEGEWQILMPDGGKIIAYREISEKELEFFEIKERT